MDSISFVKELAAANEALLGRLEPEGTLSAGASGPLTITGMLRIALKNEMEATELAALWMPSTPELDVKLALARQVGDEARHYRLIESRLRELGDDLEGFSALEGGYGPLFKRLAKFKDTVERVAAGQFTREAIALVKNRQFIAFCKANGDEGTARLYEETIQPDEEHHHKLGWRILERYATTSETQARARRASEETLRLADELQSLALEKKGIHHAPGC